MLDLIGLNGTAGSGKDTVGGFIREWGELRGIPVKREGFADRLKLSAARIFFPEIELEAAVSWCNRMKTQGKLAPLGVGYGGPISGREFLQRYGTEAHRDVFDKDFWIEAALRAHQPGQLLVVTDVRFENEAQAIRARGGQVWRVHRSAQITETAHVSEQTLSDDLVSAEVYNELTLEYLRRQIYDMLDHRFVLTPH